MTKITIPMSLIDTDENIQTLAMSALMKGANASYKGEAVIYPIESRFLDLNTVKYLDSVGAIIENYSVFIEITSKTDLVPSGLIGATTLNEEDVETPNTWEDWKRYNHTFYEVDDRIFIGTNAHLGKDLRVDELASVIDQLVRPQDLPQRVTEEG
tara:strand:+ start:28 stop:492 length:465 start_codon:yes stop_codon:yes gene_type:complete